MSIWTVLGVPAGSDRDAIRRGYARKLRVTNPEDDPEGFKQLRAAYETALAYADNAAAWAEDEDDEDVPEGGVTMTFSEAEFGALIGLDQPEPQFRTTPVEAPPAPTEDPTAPRFRSGPAEPEPPADVPGDLAGLFAGRDAEIADLNARLTTLARGLRGPWNGDEAGLRETLAAILAAPVMGEINLRADVEQVIAELLADTIPRSDAILLEAATAFGWSGERPGAVSPPVAAVLARLDEWRLIATIDRDKHPLRPAWRSLTRPAGAYWLWRLAAFRPGVESGVALLLGARGPIAPGLAYSFKADSVARWQRLLGRAHWTLGMFAAIPLALLLSVALDDGFDGFAPALYPWSNWAIDLAILLSPLAPYLARRWRAHWLERPHPAWLEEGWPIGLAVVLVGAIVLPTSQAALFALTLATGLAWLWMAVAGGSATIEAARARLIASVIPGIGGALFGGGWAIAALDPIHRGALALVFALGATIMFGPLTQAGALLDRVPRWRAGFAVPAVLAIAAVSYGAAQLNGIAGAPFYAAALTLVAGFTLVAAAQIAGVRGNREHLALRGLKMALVAAIVFAAIVSIDDGSAPTPAADGPSGATGPMT